MTLPAEASQKARDLVVSLPIPFDFADPVSLIPIRDAISPRTRMPMPKAPVDKHNFFQSWEYKIGPAWKIVPVQPKAKTETVDH
jgi:hypothetical protein